MKDLKEPMLNDKENKLFEALRNVSLSAEEKSSIRRNLTENIFGSTSRNFVSSNFFYQLFYKKSFQVAIAVVILIIFSGTTVAYAAQNSLPGDILYPLKTKVNEKIARIFVGNKPLAVANFDASIIETRLKEAETLLKEQKLSDALKNEIVENINEHKGEIDNVIRKMTEVAIASTTASTTNIEINNQATTSLIQNNKKNKIETRNQKFDNSNESNKLINASTSIQNSNQISSSSTSTDNVLENGQNTSNEKVNNNDNNQENAHIEQKIMNVWQDHKDIIGKLGIDISKPDNLQNNQNLDSNVRVEKSNRHKN